jgi:16S rRNA (cytosine1402-N4)-methyltransferase
MAAEVMRLLDPHPGQTILDATVGRGGHAAQIAERITNAGRLIALDRDTAMLKAARTRLAPHENAAWLQGNFREIDIVLKECGLENLDGILADLGCATDQVLDPARGFSFQEDGPLDMRLDPEGDDPTAAEMLAKMSEREIERILREYGEERHARRIARAVVKRRREAPITRTSELKRLVLANTPPGKTRLHRATRTFQALRIAVNDELGALDEFLEKLPHALAPDGRAVVISFHSLEDRRVKRAFRKGAAEGAYEILTKKPLVPTEAEVRENPRARSAKLRAVRRIET